MGLLGKPTIFRNPPCIPLKLRLERQRKKGLTWKRQRSQIFRPRMSLWPCRFRPVKRDLPQTMRVHRVVGGFAMVNWWMVFVDFDQLILTKTNLN